MENHIKSYKRHLAADRTSCTKATANQFRLFLHAASYAFRVKALIEGIFWKVAEKSVEV